MALAISPLILSLFVFFSAYALIRSTFKGYLGGLDLLIWSGPAQPEVPEDVFVPYTGEAETEEPVEEIDGNEIKFPKFAELYARLEFPTLGVGENVYFDDSNAILKKGLGQFYGTEIFGYGTPIMICGHNNRFFKNLQYLEVGDEIVATTSYGVYRYVITETAVHDISDPDAYDLNQDKEQLILYTCYPFTALGLTNKRYFVYADKVSGPYVRH